MLVQPLVIFSGGSVSSSHVDPGALITPQKLLESCSAHNHCPFGASRRPPVRGVTAERKTFTMNSSLSARNEGVVKDGFSSRDKDAVIIVDHGSRRQESNLMLNEFVAMFRGRTGHGIVEPAHMEIAKPSITDAFKLCVQQGAKRVIISPFFLSPGRHWNQDVPALAAEAAREHPGISYIVTAPLGLHELLVMKFHRSRCESEKHIPCSNLFQWRIVERSFVMMSSMPFEAVVSFLCALISVLNKRMMRGTWSM